jgi:hypothetical protein
MMPDRFAKMDTVESQIAEDQTNVANTSLVAPTSNQKWLCAAV